VYGTLTFLDLAGAVALLLWGVHMVQSGVQRAFGGEFRGILSRGFSGRLQAFAAGLGVTAVLQSSTATALMITSFAAGGFVALVPALAAMLGANVGTTLIVQLCPSTSPSSRRSSCLSASSRSGRARLALATSDASRLGWGSC
jgi:phosphate:Na+ symporter